MVKELSLAIAMEIVVEQHHQTRLAGTAPKNMVMFCLSYHWLFMCTFMDPLLQTCFQHWFLQVLRTGSLDAGLLCKVLGLELGNLVCLGVDIGDEMRIQAFSVHYAGFKMSLLYQFLCFLMLGFQVRIRFWKPGCK